jgi:hypothetical protein
MKKEKEVTEMSTDNYCPAKKTAMPVVAGIFNIVIGSFCLLGVLILAIVTAVAAPFAGGLAIAPGLFVTLIAIPVLAIGVISLLGGIYGVQRRLWGWALAGSITTTLVSNVFGIVAIVLTAVSKNEFAQ